MQVLTTIARNGLLAHFYIIYAFLFSLLPASLLSPTHHHSPVTPTMHSTSLLSFGVLRMIHTVVYPRYMTTFQLVQVTFDTKLRGRASLRHRPQRRMMTGYKMYLGPQAEICASALVTDHGSSRCHSGVDTGLRRLECAHLQVADASPRLFLICRLSSCSRPLCHFAAAIVFRR